MARRNIFLIGFMGSGKTTVADHLGNMFNMEIAEMDQIIAKRQNMSISDIFATHGEDYFRDLETELLIEMQSRDGMIISCGGGTPMRDNNVEEMKKSGKIVLLKASPKTIYERVKENHDRPLLEHNKNVPYIAELMEQRREKYEKAADFIIETDNKDIRQICEEIRNKL